MITNFIRFINGRMVQPDEIVNLIPSTPPDKPEPDQPAETHSVVIGGKTYRTVSMPDGREWLAENLTYLDDNIGVGELMGSIDEPRADWYRYSQTEYETYGLLYNYAAATYLNDHKNELFPGWHVPSKEELDNLVASVGDASNIYITGWNDGTDTYGFGLQPAGFATYAYGENRFVNLGNTAVLMSKDAPSPDSCYVLWCSNDAHTSPYAANFQYSLRLVKDK